MYVCVYGLDHMYINSLSPLTAMIWAHKTYLKHSLSIAKKYTRAS